MVQTTAGIRVVDGAGKGMEEAAAKARAAEANTNAAALMVDARYEVVPFVKSKD
jgi:hypothetical protein